MQTSKLVEVEKLLHSANVMHSTQEISGGWEKAREGVPVHFFWGNAMGGGYNTSQVVLLLNKLLA